MLRQKRRFPPAPSVPECLGEATACGAAPVAEDCFEISVQPQSVIDLPLFDGLGVRLIFVDKYKSLWGFDIFVTTETFGPVDFDLLADRISQHFSHEHARTCIFIQNRHICKQVKMCRSACPHEYPHPCTRWIRFVDNLWIMWITPVETAKFRHFSPVKLWITLWTLWMNTLFGCA